MLEHHRLPKIAIFRDLCIPNREDDVIGIGDGSEDRELVAPLKILEGSLEPEEKERRVSLSS